jgi:hypothetical protein
MEMKVRWEMILAIILWTGWFASQESLKQCDATDWPGTY